MIRLTLLVEVYIKLNPQPIRIDFTSCGRRVNNECVEV